MTDSVLRAVLATEAMLALLLAGQWVGAGWAGRTWPLRVIMLGALGVLAYVLAGQAKARNLGVPFDAFSWVGLIAYAVLLTGFVCHLVHERQRASRGNRRGR